MPLQLRHFKAINEDTLAYIIGHSDLSDLNPGSIIRIISEAASLEAARVYVQLQSTLNLFSIDKSSGEDLDERAADFDATREPATKSSGVVTIGDSDLTVADTALSTLKTALAVIDTTLVLQDIDFASFPAAGTVIVDRGNALRESLTYTSKTGPDTLNLAGTPSFAHVIGATVHLSTVGSDRAIALGTIGKTENPEVKYETTAAAILLDGDFQVTNIPILSQETGKDTEAAAGIIALFDGPPFPTATITNPGTVRGGVDRESDEDFRARIKEEQQALSSSTALRILNEALNVEVTATGQRVITAKVIEPVTPGAIQLFINDGSAAYSPTTVSVVASEIILSSAEAGQRRGGLINWPIVDNSERLFISLERGASTSVAVGSLTDTSQSFAPTSVPASGSITTIAGSLLVDGETFTDDDGINPPTVFEFDSNASVTPGNVAVPFTAGDTTDDIRDAIITAAQGVGSTFRITYTNGGAATVTRTNDFHGVHGNTTASDTVADGGFVITDMTLGVDGPFPLYKLKDDNGTIFDVVGSTSDTITLDTTATPAAGDYALFDPSTTVFGSGGSLLVKTTDYIINNTNGQFKLTTASFPTGLVAKDILLAFYDGVTAAYVYFDGLLQLVQKTINGDPTDIDTFPGVQAAGTRTDIDAPTVSTITVNVSISAILGIDETTLTGPVESAIVEYINNLNIGDDVLIARIIGAALTVEGVDDVNVVVPSANVVISDTTLAKTTLSDVTAS